MGFSINDVTEEMESEANSFGLIPEGEHNFVIESARVADNKQMTGEYIEITCILEGTNKKYWHYFNWKHSNSKVVSMAKVELKNLLLAIGMKEFKTVSELVQKLFRGQVEHQRDKSGKLQARVIAFGEYKWSGNQPAPKTSSEEDVPF